MGLRRTQRLSNTVHQVAREAGDSLPFGFPAVLRYRFITNNPSKASVANDFCRNQSDAVDEEMEDIASWRNDDEGEKKDWVFQRTIEDKRRCILFSVYKQEGTNRVSVGNPISYHLRWQTRGVDFDLMDKQKYMVQSVIAASTAHTITAERNALRKLRPMLTAEQWRQYVLTGMFNEQSGRSHKFYWFRKCAPIIVSNLWRCKDGEVVELPLVALCVHPQGYYEDTTAGALCPTDNIIAELLLMRTDEYTLWKKATQHPLDIPNARF
jgi:hypothetical protein